MEAEMGVYMLLSENEALSAIVGSRIYPVTHPQNSPIPALVYSQLEEEESSSKDGPVSNGWNFQITILGASNQQSRTISRLVKSALNWKIQAITGGTLRTRFSDEIDANWETENQYFQIVQEYRARKAK
jgi:hypothetical protein